MENIVAVYGGWRYVVCCEGMARGFAPCTDNEGYGKLLCASPGPVIFAGCHGQPFKFCPWCGSQEMIKDA